MLLGGHGALIVALKTGSYAAASAFSAISNPANPACPWGQKAFSNYLGADQSKWDAWDASELVKGYAGDLKLKLDLGSADNFKDPQLLTPTALLANAPANVTIDYNLREGYDHSYWFVQSFVQDHLEFHAAALA